MTGCTDTERFYAKGLFTIIIYITNGLYTASCQLSQVYARDREASFRATDG